MAPGAPALLPDCHWLLSAFRCPASPPQDEPQRVAAKRIMEAVAAELGHEVLAWRSVPTDNRSLGASAVKVEPVIEQWIVSAAGAKHRQLEVEAQVSAGTATGVHVPSVGFARRHATPFCGPFRARRLGSRPRV